MTQTRFSNNWHFVHKKDGTDYYCGTCGTLIPEDQDDTAVVTTYQNNGICHIDAIECEDCYAARNNN